jgi:Tfp pilus assembly protein PilE
MTLRHMTDKGVTLIELVVVITIIIILVFALGFMYQGWLSRYNVEENIKQVYTDLMDARGRAMDRSLEYFVDFPQTTQYQVVEDTNNSYTEDAGDITLPTFPKTVGQPFYAYSYNGNGSPTGMTLVGVTTIINGGIVFDKAGGVTIATLSVNPASPTVPVTTGIISFTQSSAGQTAGAFDYDCISISPTRINLGQMNGGVCYVK